MAPSPPAHHSETRKVFSVEPRLLPHHHHAPSPFFPHHPSHTRRRAIVHHPPGRRPPPPPRRHSHQHRLPGQRSLQRHRRHPGPVRRSPRLRPHQLHRHLRPSPGPHRDRPPVRPPHHVRRTHRTHPRRDHP